MRVLFVVHVGETLGHLARAITIARELEKHGCITECAGHERAVQFWRAAALKGAFHAVNWEWSHNQSDPSTIRPEFGARLLESVRQVRGLLARGRPDYIVGMPGFASVQLARHYGLPHASVIHGTHLAPLIRLRDPTLEETAVLSLTTRVCVGALNDAFRLVARQLSLPPFSYEEFIDVENIFVPQPGLSFPDRVNLTVTHFVRASLGVPLEDAPTDVSDTVFITFGSGNPCDFSRLISLGRRVFSYVIANTGSLPLPPAERGVTTRPFIASADIARRVRAVVSHGGIGTVGTFAEHGLPQLIVPTEIDQANMALHAQRARLAQSLGLKSFLDRTALGRRLPSFPDSDFLDALLRLKSANTTPVPADGAETIADKICRAERSLTASMSR